MNTDTQVTLQKGFVDPVDGAGQTFRVILDVLARPGTIGDIIGPAETPKGLSAAAAAIALTLADYATPVWLAPSLSTDTITSYIRFHTSAPITSGRAQAAFAILSPESDDFDVDAFHPGTQQYPDRSTTVILQVDELDAGTSVELSGPGIDGSTTFKASGLPTRFWAEMQKNHAKFPLGVDVVLAAPGKIAAIPRSTMIKVI